MSDILVGEFHECEEWYFVRREDGSVRIRHGECAHTIPAASWASIVAQVSVHGEHAASFGAALAFHGDVTTPMVVSTRCEGCGRTLGFLHRADCTISPAIPNSPQPIDPVPPSAPDPSLRVNGLVAGLGIDAPSAPDTKPDEVVPFCAICGKRATQRDIDGNWWPPCEHAKTAGLQTFVYPGPWRTNVNDWKHWALGHGQPELASGVAQVFALDLISAKAEINRLSSSPPEGEDTRPERKRREFVGNGEGYAVRECRGHWHVTVAGVDLALPGDPYKTREAAEEACALEKALAGIDSARAAIPPQKRGHE